MKLSIIILSLFASNVLLQVCTDKTKIYQCAEKSLKDDKCLLIDTKSNKQEVYQLSNCGKDEMCFEMGNYGFCIERPPRFARFETEKCNYNRECLSNICTDGKCAAIADGQDCEDKQTSCSNKSFCNSADKKCKALIQEGQECENDQECDFPLLCGKNSDPQTNKKCIKMFSIPTGQITSRKLLCVSGFSFEKSKDNKEYCAESSSTVDKCSSDSDCKQTITFASGDTESDTGRCTCSALGTQGYCDITTDKEEWKDYIEIYTDLTKDTFGDKDNIIQLRDQSWDSPKLIQAIANVEQYSKFKDADKCAIRYLTSSNAIKHSLFMLCSLILLILF